VRALVTGGCGFIGSNLTRELYKNGWKVDIVDDMSNGHLHFLGNIKTRCLPSAGFLKHYNDIHKTSIVDEVLVIQDDFASLNMLKYINDGNYDVIFHCAANPRVEYSVQNPVETTDDNVYKTVKLYTAAINKVKRIVFSSSCSVYGDSWRLPTGESDGKNPNSPYALQKMWIEELSVLYSKLYKLDSVCLRYFNVYGPSQYGDSPYSTAISSWCNKVKSGEPLRSDGDGEQTRDMVFVEDVVRANILAATRSKDFYGKSINIGTGKSVSNNKILSVFKERFKEIEVCNAPARPGDVRHTLAEVKIAREEINFVAKIDINQGLSKTFDWWEI